MATAALTNAYVHQWQVMDLIGRGGYADVYRVQHAETAQIRAVKVLQEAHCHDKAALRRFQGEQDILAALDHPGIPRLRTSGTIKGAPCFVLDLCSGRSLRACYDEGGSFDRLGCLLGATALATYLHREGVVHGDLKLENFFLGDDGRVRLIDFGSARRVRSAATDLITRSFTRHRVTGTPTYLAPEILRGKPITYATDVWALGVVAWLLCAHRPPFEGASKQQVMRQALQCQAPGIRNHQNRLPRQVCNVVDRCLRREAKERFGDAGEMLVSLRNCFRQPGVARPDELSRALTPRTSDASARHEIDWFD